MQLDDKVMDELLRQLRHSGAAVTLDGLDESVMTRLNAYRREANGMRFLMLAAAFASLTGGAMAGKIWAQPAYAAQSLSPFAPVTALAPSTLLDAR